MLTSLVLSLQTSSDVSLPASLGRAAYAALLRLLGERDQELAEALHAGDGARPFTASNLVMGRRAGGSLVLTAGQTGWLRYTGLNRAVSEHLLALAEMPPAELELDGHRLAVTGATLADAGDAGHLWAGQISYQDLAAPFLLGSERRPSPRISFEFVSPTTFRRQGHYVPLPEPGLVFGSLFNRWQAFAPVALHPDIGRFAEEALVLSRFDIRSRGLPYKQGGVQVGFSGQVTFTALKRDRYWLNMLHLLAAFAFYSGVGYQTGTGLGQVRVGNN